MTAVWRSGAEIAPHTVDTEFTGGDLTNASQDSTIKRSGSSSLKFAGTGYNYSTAGFNVPGATMRTYLYAGGAPSGTGNILGFVTAAGDVLGQLALQADRRLVLQVNGYPTPPTALATSGFTIPTGTFDNCLELWLDRSTNILATRYNGTEWARAHVTFAEAGNIDAAWFGPGEYAVAGGVYYDDMAINALSGAYNNGWCGPSAGGVLTFRPTGTVENAWTLAGAATTHECLDDLAPDGFTTCIQQVGGTIYAAAGVTFPAWPVSVPGSCMMVGIVGTSATPTSLNVTLRDANNLSATDALITLDSGWQRRYPVITAERAWDGTRRSLNNGYLMPSSGGVGRVAIVRADSLAVTQSVTTIWMTVDFPLALAAAPAPVGVHQATILATVVNP